MKANRFRQAARRPAMDDRGISNVLGAILMFALFVVTLITVQVRYVPVWDENREVRFTDRVQGQLALLKSDLDRQVDNRTDVPVTEPLSLGMESGFSFFRGARLAGTATFLSTVGSGAVTFQSPHLTILQQNGKSFLGLVDPTGWVPLDNSGDEYQSVASVRVLRVQIPWPSNTNDCDTDITAVLHVSDSAGDELAKAEMTCHDSSSERTIRTSIWRRDTVSSPWEEVSSDVEAIFQGADADFFYVDLLEPALLFDVVLAGLDTPLILSMEKLGLAANYILVYDDTSGGTNGGGSGATPGLEVDNYGPATFTSGAIQVETNNERFVDQTFILEHGAILVDQAGDAAMLVPPLMQFTDSGDQAILEWTLPSLDGSTQALSGADSVSVIADPSGERFELRAVGSQFIIDIPSNHPEVWEDFLRRSLRDVGFVESPAAGAEFDIVTDADSCTLTLDGEDLDPDADDLLLDLTQASIGLELQASG